jgi:hypothetical protein
MNRMRSEPESKALAERFYLYWGLAIRSLNEHLDVEESRTGDMIIAGILTLLFTEVSQYSVKK